MRLPGAPRTALTAIAAALALAACQPATPPSPPTTAAPSAAPASTPAPAHVSRTAKLARFLQQRYGAAAQLRGDWTGRWGDGDDAREVSYHVCAEQPVVIGDRWQQLLAVCGTLADAGHPDPGVIDFHVLRDGGERFEVAASLTGQTFGSMGNPGEVSVLRLGSDFYGFLVRHGWAGQGYLLLSQDLVVPGRDGLVNAGSLRRHIDNQAALDCDAHDAGCDSERFDVDFDLQPDASDPTARIWPLDVREEGHACGHALSRQHRFSLDTTHWTYPFPDALRREGCD